MTPLLGSRTVRITAAAVAVVLVAVGFLPLFGGVGYEYGLACGLLLPGAAAIATALDTSAGDAPPLACVGRGLALGALLAVLAMVLGLLHGLFVGVCNLWGGLFGFTLAAGAGAVVGGAWGAVAGQIARGAKRRRLLAVLVALAAPLGGVVVSVWRFYSSPMIFAFNPFVGYFSGTLYDTVIEPGSALYTYRVRSAAAVVGLVLLASVLRRKGEGRGLALDLTGVAATPRLVLALLGFATWVVMAAEGAALGHWSTASSIAKDLGGRRSGPRCDVVYPDSLREDEAALLLADCEQEIAADEKTVGARGPSRITAFFFRDAGDKKRLMGAANTYIAKPWRHEVYLQMDRYPHPVLGHEIAHVVAGSFGRGPFRIAGALHGLWPNPGLIEGVAVATSPDQDELTDMEWARAMMDKGRLPPMQQIFSFGFLGESAHKSYTLAGAFVRWLADTHGWGTVRAWYGGASLEALLGQSWHAIDDDFRRALEKVTLPPSADAYVASRFERPAVFGRRCPHEVDALRGQADACRDTHRLDCARAGYAGVLARDPHDYPALLDRATMELRSGDAAKGRAELDSLIADDKVPLAFRDHAREAEADSDLARGDGARAAPVYDDLAAHVPNEDHARTLEVKAIAARLPEARLPVVTLLVAAPGDRPADPDLAAAMIGEWYGKTGSPLAAYLLAKHALIGGYYGEAAPELDQVLAAPPDAPLTKRVRKEALRQRAVCACALHDVPAIDRVRGLVEAPDSPFVGSAGGRREAVLRLLNRCR